MEPTKQQQQVINHGRGRAVVFAVAGSGKTSTVTIRIQKLITSENIAPHRILATTFGREAKRQIEEKLAVLNGCKGVDVRTLSSIAYKIYTTDNANLPPKIQADDSELAACYYEALDRIKKGNGINDPKADIEMDIDKIKQIEYTEFANYLMQLKGDMLVTPWMHERLPERAKPFFKVKEYRGNEWLRVLIDTYEDERKRRRLMGYDDIMINSVVRLGVNSGILEMFTTMYDYIIVDEYQDVNEAQNMMLNFLDRVAQNMMVVGDDDQTIYEWRGARPIFIKEKLEDPNWTVFKLDRNFRSSPGPVVLASQVIRHNQNRAPKNMMATKPFSGVLDIRAHDSSRNQAKEIVALVESYIEDGSSLNETVILIRRYAETPLIEHSLIKAGIRYEIPGSVPFYARRETAHILTFLELLTLEHKRIHGNLTAIESNRYYEAWKRIYSKPKTFIKRAELEKMMSVALSSRDSIVELLERINEERIANKKLPANIENLVSFFGAFIGKDPQEIKAGDAIDFLESTIGIKQWIRDTSINYHVGNIKAEIVDALADYAYEDTLDYFLESIERIKQFNETARNESSEPTLKILTVFKAKGLEFSNVIIPNANRVGASANSNNNQNQALNNTSDCASIEEERRIFYVAITRAIHNLHIFHISSMPSEHLTEANYGDILRSIANIKKVFDGDLSDAEIHGPEYFANNVVARMINYQLGNACARNWGERLDATSIQAIREKGYDLLSIAGQAIPKGNWECEQYQRVLREWIKMCDFAASYLEKRRAVEPRASSIPVFEQPRSQAYLFDQRITAEEIEYE